MDTLDAGDTLTYIQGTTLLNYTLITHKYVHGVDVGGLKTLLHPSFIPLGPIKQCFQRLANCKVDLPSGRMVRFPHLAYG